MAVATSNQLVVKTRDQWISYYLRSRKNANPGESIEPNSPAWIAAAAIADCLVVQGSNCQQNAAGVLIANQNTDQINSTGAILGIDRPAATGASGSVVANVGSLGSTIYQGDSLTNLVTGVRYKVTTSGLYMPGQLIPVVGIDTGPNTNLDAGIPLTWASPRPGCNSTALVYEQPDGTGLTGGANAASDDEYKQIIQYALANESASGNEATIIKLLENSRGHGVAVQKGFVYPALNGPGTVGVCFTLKPQSLNGSRSPNSTQLSAVLAYLQAWLPGSVNVFMLPIVGSQVTLVAQAKWSPSSPGWIDISPWPTYSLGRSYIVSSSGDASTFTVALSGSSPDYTSAPQPTAGQTIAVYNAATATFYRKVITGVSGTGPWVLTCSTIATQSDTTYAPEALDIISPYSDSLVDVANSFVSYVQSMGPGEQVASDPGDGFRQMRQPRPLSNQYPETISSQVVADALKLPAVADVELVSGLLATVPVGALLAYSRIFQNPQIGIYPL